MAGAAARHLHSLVGLRGPTAIAEAIRRVWASSLLASSVTGFANAAIKDVALAVMLQRTVVADVMGLLTRTPGLSDPTAHAKWHVGVLLQPDDEDEDKGWARRGQLFLPMSVTPQAWTDTETPAPAEPLASLYRSLEPRGFEVLNEIGEAVEHELGPTAVVHFAVTRDETTCVQVIAADESPRWQTFRTEQSAFWSEITLPAHGSVPATELSRSLAQQVVLSATTAALGTLRCSIVTDENFMTSWNARSYVNVSQVTRALKDVPLLTPEFFLRAVGSVGAEARRQIAGSVAAEGKSRWRRPLIAASALGHHVGIEREIEQRERRIRRDARGFTNLDLTLLPSDAMSTTLSSARSLLERVSELWAQCATATITQHLAIRALIARHVPELPPLTTITMTGGRSAPPLVNFVQRLGDTLRTVAADETACAQLNRQLPQDVAQLPDGRGRGALGQLLAIYGELCTGLFELAEPRWCEDASGLCAMLRLLLPHCATGGAADVRTRMADARALVDTELARYEPEIPPLERGLMRRLVDRCRVLTSARGRIDRLMVRALFLVRKVILDIDRRLRRIDAGIPPGGAFHCSADTLAAALKSGRPELGRVIRMRVLEREHLREEPAPPLSFHGAPPRGGIPLSHQSRLEGTGVSAGVAEGRVRKIGRRLPHTMTPGDILVLPSADPGRVPLYLIAGAVITETGGAISPPAEVARELAVPAVFSAQQAGLVLQEGEHVRVDGELGTIERLSGRTDPQ